LALKLAGMQGLGNEEDSEEAADRQQQLDVLKWFAPRDCCCSYVMNLVGLALR
jgi:hypothetical protein